MVDARHVADPRRGRAHDDQRALCEQRLKATGGSWAGVDLACYCALVAQVHNGAFPFPLFYISVFFLLQKGFCNIWGAKMIFVKYGNCPHKYNAMFDTATKSLEEV